MSLPTLRPTEVRVLGSLIEKAMTTPEYYPLSLNALKNACNQKNNREPVLELDEETVEEALGTLHRKELAEGLYTEGSRVEKFRHTFTEAVPVTRKQLAVLCELFLRGPQTLGELHTRTKRLTSIGSIDDVAAVIDSLTKVELGPAGGGSIAALVKKLEKRPGQKDNRYVHLLCPDQLAEAEGEPHRVGAAHAGASPTVDRGGHPGAVLLKQTGDERIRNLESEVAALRRDITILTERLEGVSRQLEERRH